METIRNLAFIFDRPNHKECSKCRFMNLCCDARLRGFTRGFDLTGIGHCSGYRFSFIKAFKRLWRIK